MVSFLSFECCNFIQILPGDCDRAQILFLGGLQVMRVACFIAFSEHVYSFTCIFMVQKQPFKHYSMRGFDISELYAFKMASSIEKQFKHK